MRARALELARSLPILLALLAGMHVYRTCGVARGTAPRIAHAALEGSEVKVPSDEGRPRLVRFFATWCGVCRAEEHNLKALADSASIVLVASDSGSAEAVRAYARAHGLTMPIVVDDGTLKRAYRVSAYPTSFFVDGGGEIDFVTVGYTTELGMRLRLLATR